MTAYMTDREAEQLATVLQALTDGAKRHGFRWGPMRVTTSLGAELTVVWTDENGGLYVVDFNAYWGQ